MANIPYSPIPETTAHEAPLPDVSFHSGALAKAVTNFGSSISALGGANADIEFARAGLQDELIANDANTEAMKTVSGLYSDYQKKKGRSAQDGLSDFQASLDKVYEDSISKMPNLQARTQLATALRYTTRSYLSYARAHADSEFDKWQTESASAAANEMGNQAVLAINNPDQVEVFAEGAADQVRKLYEQQGWTPDVSEQKAKETRSAVLSKTIQSAFDYDPNKAQGLYDRFKGQLTSGDTVTLDNKFRSFNADVEAEGLATKISNGNEAAALIKHEEGFRPSAYYDVNAYRTGYGSDTVTLADGTIQRVGSGTTTTAADAERDLNRRISDITKTLAVNVGQDVWNNLPEGARAGLASVAYNYGTAPSSVIEAARTGDVNKIADAVAALPANPERRQREASVILGGLVPKADAIAEALAQTKDRPDFQSRVLTFLNRKYDVEDARTADFNRQLELDNKIKAKASDDTENALLPYLFPELSGKSPPSNLGEMVVNDPTLTSAAKLRIVGVLNRADAGQPMAAKSHRTSIDLLTQMRAPEDDPNRMTSVQPIYDEYIKGNLNNGDFNFLVGQYNDSRTPDGQRLQSSLGDFFGGMKASITKSNPLLGNLDQSGDQQFYAFQHYVNNQIAKARQDKKDPYSLIDPGSPDYLGSPAKLAPFQKSALESVQDAAKSMQPTTWDTGVKELKGGGTSNYAPVPQSQQPSASPNPPAVVPRAPGETPQEYLQRTQKAPNDAASGVVDIYRKALTDSGKFTPEEVEQKVQEYTKALSGKQGMIDGEIFNKMALGDRLALMEHALG